MHSILIVENNEFYRQSFMEILRLYLPSLVIAEAVNGREALEKIEIQPPDIVFMDIRLNGKNGLELTKEIKARNPAIYIVILTNYDYSEYRETAFWFGADHFLLKDAVSGAEIAELIKRILSEKVPADEDGKWFAAIHKWVRVQPTG